MGKKKKKNYEQRRQKKIARVKARRKQKIQIKGSTVSSERIAPKFPEEEYHWWLAHSLNYLTSNYDEGTWDPVCDLYSGQKAPSPPELFELLVTKLGIEDPSKTSERENFLLAWVLGVNNEALYGMIFALISILTKEDPEIDTEEIRQPYNGQVWSFFNEYIKSKVLE